VKGRLRHCDCELYEAGSNEKVGLRSYVQTNKEYLKNLESVPAGSDQVGGYIMDNNPHRNKNLI